MRAALLALSLLLTACSPPLPVEAFRSSPPEFDPIRFFTGHSRSWGVLEDRAGQPTGMITTDCQGVVDGPDSLRMTQILTIAGDKPVTREWRMRRLSPGRYEATANDMVGGAIGEAAGRAFHWRWTLAMSPGNALKNVELDQWWYLQPDGSLLNRTTIRKLSVIAAEVTEHFIPER